MEIIYEKWGAVDLLGGESLNVNYEVKSQINQLIKWYFTS